VLDDKFYDREGNKVTLQEWTTLMTDEYRRVASTEVGRFWVSTVFLGIDHSWDNGPLQIYETMIFERDSTTEADEWPMMRYATEVEARMGHMKVVQMIQTNVDFIIDEEPTLI